MSIAIFSLSGYYEFISNFFFSRSLTIYRQPHCEWGRRKKRNIILWRKPQTKGEWKTSFFNFLNRVCFVSSLALNVVRVGVRWSSIRSNCGGKIEKNFVGCHRGRGDMNIAFQSAPIGWTYRISLRCTIRQVWKKPKRANTIIAHYIFIYNT